MSKNWVDNIKENNSVTDLTTEENAEMRNKNTSVELDKLKKDIEKKREMLKNYSWYFQLEIPNERQSAIEYDLDEICIRQGCTIEDVLELNNISIGELKPGKIITIPIISWKNDEEILFHEKEDKNEKKVDWWIIKNTSTETQKLAEKVNMRNGSDTSLIFDKKNARMYILKEWKIVYSTIFLSGKNNTTDTMSFPALTAEFTRETNPDFMITPAGKFPVSLNEESEDYNTSKISFDYLVWIDANGAIHPPTKKSWEGNMQALASPTIKDNNTSWWCMVMTPEALEVIKKHYQENKTYAYVIPLHGKMENYLQID